MNSRESRIENLLVHDAFIRALARSLLADRGAAEDVAQDAWVALLERKKTKVGSLPRWISGIVRNLAKKNRRSEARRRTREETAARSEGVPSAAEILEREAARSRIVAAVLALEEPYRSTVLLRYFEDLPPRAIARRQGVPVETVRTRIKRALAMLRDKLDREYGDRAVWCAVLLPLARRPSIPSLIAPLTVMTLQTKIAVGVVALVSAAIFLFQERRRPAPEPRIAAAAELEESPAESIAAPSEKLIASTEAELRSTVAEEKPSTEPAAAEGSGSLRVRVFWADRTAAVGVTVRAEPWNTSSPALYAVEAKTDEKGECHLESRVGRVLVQVDRMDHPRWVELEPGEEAILEFVIPVGFEVEGIVVDAEGRPVAGAEIRLAFQMTDTGFVIARSGTDGGFAIRSCPSGFYIAARAKDHSPSLQQLLLADVATKLFVKLVLWGVGGAVEGVVFDPSGKVVENALVLVGGRHQGWGTVLRQGDVMGVPPGAFLTQADERGRFAMDGVELGVVPIEVRAQGLAVWHGEVEVFEGRTSKLDIWLPEGFVLAGRIVDGMGHPTTGEVSIGVWRGPLDSWTWTGADGVFRFDDLAPGTIEVYAEGDAGRAATRITGAPGDELFWEAVLEKAGTLRGRVVDENGIGLGGWYVRVEDEQIVEGQFEWASVKTDEQGRFVADDLHDRPHRVHVHADGCWTFPSAVATGIHPGEELLLRVEASGVPSVRIVGSILGEDGRPATGVLIEPWLSGFTNAPIETLAANGRFEFGPYPSGTWSLTLRAQGVPELRLEPKELGIGETWDLGEIVLEAEGFDPTR